MLTVLRIFAYEYMKRHSVGQVYKVVKYYKILWLSREINPKCEVLVSSNLLVAPLADNYSIVEHENYSCNLTGTDVII